MPLSAAKYFPPLETKSAVILYQKKSKHCSFQRCLVIRTAVLHNEISEEGKKSVCRPSDRRTGCMKEGTQPHAKRERERERKRPLKLKSQRFSSSSRFPAAPHGIFLPSFLPASLTHSRGKNEATLHSQGPEIPRPVVIHNYRALHLE